MPAPPFGGSPRTARTLTRLAAAALVVAASSAWTLSPAAGELSPSEGEWSSFRGPNFDGHSSESGLLTEWPDDGPEIVWQATLGSGFSGITAAGGRVFTLYGRGGRELATGFDAETGEVLWTADVDRERKDRFGDGPRATPPVDDGRLFAVSALGKLQALDADRGELLWSHDLVAGFGARVPEFGVSASPIVEGDLLLVNAGGKGGHAMIAFDKASGKVVWSAESDLPGYASPVAFTAGGLRQAIFFTGSNVVAVEAGSGKVLWKQPWKTAYNINAASPIFVSPDRLFVSSGHDTGAAMFQLGNGATPPTILWKTREMRNHFSSSVYYQGHIYGFDNKNFKCIDATTGENRWRKGSLGHGSLFYADGHLIVLSDDGQLLLVEASPKAYREKASYQVARAKHWTVPTLYQGKLYVRNERELFGLSVAK